MLELKSADFLLITFGLLYKYNAAKSQSQMSNQRSDYIQMKCIDDSFAKK
jgi:hypothetical protein